MDPDPGISVGSGFGLFLRVGSGSDFSYEETNACTLNHVRNDLVFRDGDPDPVVLGQIQIRFYSEQLQNLTFISTFLYQYHD